MRTFIYGVVLFVIAQSLIWIQTNGQFVWPWFKRNPLVISAVGGTLISYMFIKATYMVAQYFDGLLWPGRFLTQAIGIVTFSLLTFLFLNEGINTKTAISLFLAVVLIAVQIFWK
jgi:hypothetical protein